MSPVPSDGLDGHKVTASKRLQTSKLSNQLETLNDDVDLSSLHLALRGSASFNVLEAIIDGTITRTIEGASLVKLTLFDRDRKILRSKYLTSKTDILVDGLWFRLVNTQKRGDNVILTFEDREVAVLRSYPKPHSPHNGFLRRPALNNDSRAEFAQYLVSQPDRDGVLAIRFHCPSLQKHAAIKSKHDVPTQPEKDLLRRPGFAPGAAITVQNDRADATQRANIGTVLDVGLSLGARRKVLVAADMVITVESWARNLPDGDADSAGIFQQRPSQGWGTYAQITDVATAAHSFFAGPPGGSGGGAIGLDQREPNLDPAVLAQRIQISAFPERYGAWRIESERTVSLYGILPTTETAAAQGSLLTSSGSPTRPGFTRGTKQTQGEVTIWQREDNWDCVGRLATEVKWRRFCVSGTVYFMSDQELFASRPVMRISEDSPGVDSIDVDDYDVRKKTVPGVITVSGRVSRWQAPPGSMVELFDMGLFSGRWLVSTIERPIFDTQGTFTLVKPQQAFPEHATSEWGSGQVSGQQLQQAPPLPGDGGDAGGAIVGIGETVTAAVAAALLLPYIAAGRLTDHPDIRATARGQAVTNRGGQLIHVDTRVMQSLLWLMQSGEGISLGLSAVCSDHHDDGANGHFGGHAWDMNVINGIRVDTDSAACKRLVLALDGLLRAMPATITLRQLISGGYGNHRDDACSRLSIPAADSFYGSGVMAQHCNHVHAGF